MKIHLTRQKLAARWSCSVRKIDRLRDQGLLPWLDLTAGKGKRPVVRFRIDDVEIFEKKWTMDIQRFMGSQS